MSFLANKRALVIGVANDRSIAWGIAKQLHAQGAEVILTYQTDKLKSRVEAAAAELNSPAIFPLDATSDEQIAACMEGVKGVWTDGFDILVHSIAYAPKNELDGKMIENGTREGFHTAMEVSVYSLTALTKAAYPLMKGRQASIINLSYLGAVRAVPNYNTMGIAKAALEATTRYLAVDLGKEGIRVNSISAGPIRTLAASGIKDFRTMLDNVAEMTPTGKNVTIEEVGNTAAFLASDLSSGITGHVIYVDGGFNIVAAA